MQTPIEFSTHTTRMIHLRQSVTCHSFVLALALLLVANAPAATVVLQPGVNGYAGATDAWLDESAETRNYGGSTYVRVQYNSGMSDSTVIRFGLPTLTFQSVVGATLGLCYYDQSSMSADNALWITPYRIAAGLSWYENIYDGTAGYGVNWRYRDAAQTLPWTSQYGAWYDKIDDGNSTNKVKRVGGSAPDAIAPTNWVTWNVLNSVAQWHAGQENDGFVLFESGFQGSGYILASLFYSREFGTSTNRPYLGVSYLGAQIPWTGGASAIWDTTALNWNVGGYPGTFGAGDYVTFSDGASNPTIIVTGGGVTPGSVTISNNSTAYSLTGGSIGGGGPLTKAGPGTGTLSAANGYGGLTLVKAGRLLIGANNALGTTGSGTVVSNGAALGLQAVTYSSTEPLTLSGAGVSNSGALYAASGSCTFAGPVTLAADSTVGVGAGLALTLSGAIGGGCLTKNGDGSLTLSGAAANTYAGVTSVSQGTLALAKSLAPAVPGDLTIGDGTNAAYVRLDAHNQLGAASDVTIRKGNLLNLNGWNSTIGNLILDGGTVSTLLGTLTLAGNIITTPTNLMARISGNLNLGGTARTVDVADGTASDDLALSAAVSNGGLVKTGAGRLALGGVNTFDGDLIVSNGSVAAVSSAALGSTLGGTVVGNGARLELRGAVSIGGEKLTLSGSGGGLGALRNVSEDNRWGGALALGAGAMIEADTNSLTLDGPVSGAGFGLNFNTTGNIVVNGAIADAGTSVTKNGLGILTFAGGTANTYTGPTTINQGSLLLAKLSGGAVPAALIVGDGLSAATVLCQAANQFSPGGDVTVNLASLLNLNNSAATIASLTLSGGAVDSGSTGLLTLGGPLTGNGTQAASISGNLALSATMLDFSVLPTADLNIPAVVSGGGFSKKGAGRLLLMGNNTFTGTVQVVEGTLLVNNDANSGFGLGSGPVLVTNAVLGGVGSIAGPVTIGPRGMLNPGAGIGTLVVSNNLTLGANARLLIEAGGPSPAHDQVDLRQGGDVVLDSGALLTLVGGLTGTNPYRLVTQARSVSGAFQGLPADAPMPGQPGWHIHYGTHRIYLSRVTQPLTYFRAFSTNGVVVVSWRTAEEVDTKTFDLYQQATGGEWRQVNATPIPAQGPAGGTYLLIDPLAQANDNCRFRLVANTLTGGEIFEFERTATEFAFSTTPKPTANGLELRWWARTDESYDLLGAPGLSGAVWSVIGTNLLATPPECVFTNPPSFGEGYFRLRLVP